jgi:hypothetical protein
MCKGIKNVKLCLARIQKRNVNLKKFNKNKKFTLYSLEQSISLGKDQNQHIDPFLLAFS